MIDNKTALCFVIFGPKALVRSAELGIVGVLYEILDEKFAIDDGVRVR